jgi:hypothetical protein
MKKMTLALGVGALTLAIAGGAVAQQAMKRDGMGRMMRDTFGTTTVTRAEAQAKAAEAFALLDVNKDGKLDQADRDARRAAQTGAMFDTLDTNHDGRIDKAEFAAAHNRPMGPDGRGPNGMARHGMGGRGMGRDGMGGNGMGGGRIIGGMDANGDKAVSRDEFIAGALKRFDAADANKDGKVTPEERRAAMRTFRGLMPGNPAASAPAPAKTAAPAPAKTAAPAPAAPATK